MPPNPELQLISLIAETGELRPVLRAGLRKEMMSGAEARAMFKYIMDYFRGTDTRNLVPTRDQLLARFPSVDIPPAPIKRTTLAALVKEVRNFWVGKQVVKILEDGRETLEFDPDASVSFMLHDLRNLVMGSRPGGDIILADGAPDAWERYMAAKSSDVLQGIPYPQGWGRFNDDGRPRILDSTGRQDHPLNEQTRGLIGGQLIIFYGRPKSMKTWSVVDIAADAHARYNCRVLFYTKELRPEQVEDRILAREAEVLYSAMRMGTLDPFQEAVLRDISLRMAEEETRFNNGGRAPSLLITSGWGERGSNDIDCLYAKAEEFEPDLIIADAAYLMEEHTGGKKQIWESMTNVSRALKRCANDLGVPVVATTQANRSGEDGKGQNVSEIAYSDALGQDCDMAVRVIKQERDGGDGVHLDLVIPAAREITLAGLRLHVIPATTMRLVHTYESQRRIQQILQGEAMAYAEEQDRASKRVAAAQSRSKTQAARRQMDGGDGREP